MKRNLFTILLTLGCALCLCFALTACSGEHNHTFSHYIYNNDATCLEDGTETATCDYGGCTETDTRIAQRSAPGYHLFLEYRYNGDATCLEDGTETATCAREGCTATDTRIALNTAAHDPEFHKGTATCSAAGTIDFWRCRTCGEDFIDADCSEEVVSYESATPLGHTFTAENKCVRYEECGTEWQYTEGLEFEYKNLQDAYAVKGIGTASGNVVIPYGYRGKPVTSINNLAFLNCTALTGITIPDSVTAIGDQAFEDCSELENVVLGNGVPKFELPGFYGCNKLKCVTVDEKNPYFGSRDGILYNKELTEFVYVPSGIVGPVTVPDSIEEIPDDAFANCVSLESITLPDGIKKLGDWAFNGCIGLKSFVIPQGVTSTGYAMFGGCSGLTSVTIPEGVTSIGDYSFENCSALASIDLPNSVASIGYGAFSGCSGLTGDLRIPAGVTSIEMWAFSGCSGLESITIDDAVTPIGNQAFINCYGLTSVTTGDGVTSIGDYAFRNCYKLASITIGNGVTSIGERAFENCYSLTKAVIGSSLKEIKAAAFGSCNKLIEIWNHSGLSLDVQTSEYGDLEHSARHIYTGDEESKQTMTDDGYLFYENGEETYLLGYVGKETEIRLPETSPSDGNYAIYQYAFYNSDWLTDVTMPDGVTSIGEQAFYGCHGLTSVTIGGGVTSIGELAFSGCYRLSGELKIPDRVGSIESYAFNGCSGLTGLVIGSGVTNIGYEAFLGCYKLVEVWNYSDLPLSPGSSELGYVTYYAKSVYTGDTKSKQTTTDDGYLFYEDGTGSYLLGYTGEDTQLTLPAASPSGKNYTIQPYAFYRCDRLTSVTIPDGVTAIGEGMFDSCSGLTSVTISESVTSIGAYAFYGCEELSSVIIPESVASIGSFAFMNCYGLTSVVIPYGVTSIGDHAFTNCGRLTSMIIPDSVLSIGDSAFASCQRLTSITIGEGVTSIGEYAFDNCHEWTGEFRIPKNLTSITGSALLGCNKLESIAVDAENQHFSFQDGILYNKNKTEIVVVLKTVKGAIRVPDGASIGERAFYECNKLASVAIGHGVTSIDGEAFSSCTSLTEIRYDGTVDEWKAIPKAGSWHYETPNYTVTCTNGTITKDGAENYF